MGLEKNHLYVRPRFEANFFLKAFDVFPDKFIEARFHIIPILTFSKDMRHGKLGRTDISQFYNLIVLPARSAGTLQSL
jgi:hypothetical protein